MNFPRREKRPKRRILVKKSENVRTRPHASKRFRTHPNASQPIQTRPNVSQRIRKRSKTSTNVEKTDENFAKNSSIEFKLISCQVVAYLADASGRDSLTSLEAYGVSAMAENEAQAMTTLLCAMNLMIERRFTWRDEKNLKFDRCV